VRPGVEPGHILPSREVHGRIDELKDQTEMEHQPDEVGDEDGVPKRRQAPGSPVLCETQTQAFIVQVHTRLNRNMWVGAPSRVVYVWG